MTHIIHRQPHVTPPVAVSGEGVFITDAAGKRVLDACGGAAVSCLGHGDPDVRAAMHAQIDRLAYAHTSFFTSRAGRGAGRTTGRATAPPGVNHVYFVSGGSEAIEAALKLARQYFVEIGEPRAQRSSSRAARATTATRWGRWRWAATNPGARRTRRC